MNSTSGNISSVQGDYTECNSKDCQCPPINMTYIKGEVQEIHLNRSNHFRSICTLNIYTKRTTGVVKLINIMPLRLVTRLTPKVGSTFMINAIHYLNLGGNTDTIFSRPRKVIHESHFERMKQMYDPKTISHVGALVFARNPYSRLFSAFVDKIFIVNSMGLAQSVRKFINANKNIDCVLDLEFSDFLKYALYAKTRVIDDHYRPASDLLNVHTICHAREIFIVKQETFSTDMEFLFTQRGLAPYKRDTLHRMVSCKRALSNVEELTYTSFLEFSNSVHHDCLNWNILTKRLWQSFQIQGYIHERSPLPKFEFSTKHDAQVFLRFVVEARTEHPVSKEQSALQRRKAITNVYNQVHESLKEDIVTQYHEDFELFQYDPSSVI